MKRWAGWRGWLVWPRGACCPPGSFPEITRTELVRYFTLTGPDVAFLRKFRSRVTVLGAGVQYSGPGSWSCSTISSVQPDERLERVRLLREQGRTPKQVARALGVSPAEAGRLV